MARRARQDRAPPDGAADLVEIEARAGFPASDPPGLSGARLGEPAGAAPAIRLKRVYEPPTAADGVRVLVDRLWPRGFTKAAAAIDRWLRDIAPSAELRRWFAHRVERWPEFRRRYPAEVKQRPELVAELRAMARRGPITLVYAARDEEHNAAVVLREQLLGDAALGR